MAALPHSNGGGEPLRLPVFSTASGSFVGRYDRDAMLEEALEPQQQAALATLDAAAAAPGQALSLALHAGDILFLNPQLVWKQVIGGEVPAVDEAARELLRLWLATPGSRALPESFGAVFGRPRPARRAAACRWRTGWWGANPRSSRAARLGRGSPG